jgi:hypothetical protein
MLALYRNSKLPRRTVPGQLREGCPPSFTHVDDDVDRVRCLSYGRKGRRMVRINPPDGYFE